MGKQAITVHEKSTRESVVEVEFPMYRQHILDHGTRYAKIVSVDLEYELYVQDRGEIWIEVSKPSFSGSSLDYMLCRGYYESDEAEWLKQVEKAKRVIASFGGSDDGDAEES